MRLMALVVALLLCGATAYAQTPQQVDAHLSIVIPAGWRAGFDSSAGANVLFVMAPVVTVEERLNAGLRHCEVERRAAGPAQGGQEAQNSRVAGVSAANYRHAATETLHAFSNDIVHGVRMITAETANREPALWRMQRMFFLATSGGTNMYSLSCMMRAPASDRDQAAARSFINSVSLNAGPSQ